MQVTIIGGGIAGLSCAVELAGRGVEVELLERGGAAGVSGCSWCAGGMLAPWCELEEAAEPLIARLGLEGLAWWREHYPGLSSLGTLVVAAQREHAELARFARRTRQYRWLDRSGIGELEPELAERFDTALYFADEAHLDPRRALAYLAERLIALGGTARYGVQADAVAAALQRPAGPRGAARALVDCRGLAARDVLPGLRGVRGEMLLLQTQELGLRRPVRLLHPRTPVYVVPRGQGLYMVGATMIESDDTGAITARSALELLGAAYALHPAFGEARIVEMHAQVRPAFASNLPQIHRVGQALYVNGLYRHGFLIAPALARRVAEALLHGRSDPELMHEDSAQRRLA